MGGSEDAGYGALQRRLQQGRSFFTEAEGEFIMEETILGR